MGIALLALLALGVSACEDGPEQVFTPNEGDPAVQNGFDDSPNFTQAGEQGYDLGEEARDDTGRARFCNVAKNEALIQRMVPVPAERILFTRGFKAGTWYPFKEGEDAAIADAKSVTCVGAALERAMHLNIVQGWKINVHNESGNRNIWGEMPRSGARCGTRVMRERDDVSAEITLQTGARIGRKMFDANSCFPEPVYRLDWKDPAQGSVTTVKAIFQRLTPNGQVSQETTDGLELVSVFNADTGADLTGQVILKLYPVGEHSLHWQDTGMLEIFKSTHSNK